MLPLILLCLAVATSGQQTNPGSQVESEEENGNRPAVPAVQTPYRIYRPAAQQRRVVYAADPRVPDNYAYAPYSFNYVAQGEDGSSSRQETGDASGRVVGSYTIAVEDGRRRVVDYVADQDGFRATIDTNEPGTDPQNPASVVFHSAGLGSRSNQPPATTVPRPNTSYRPTPSAVYSQPAVYRPVYHNHNHGEAYAPYRYYDNYAYDRYGHAGHAGYYNNDHRYYWY